MSDDITNPLGEFAELCHLIHPLLLMDMHHSVLLQLARAAGELTDAKFCRLTGMTADEAERHLRSSLASADVVVEQAERLGHPLGIVWGAHIQAVEDGRVITVDAVPDDGRRN